MNSIHRVVARARRLLWTQTILNILSWCLILAFSIAFIGMLVPKIWYIPITFRSWSTGWLAGAAAGATLITALVALLHRPTVLYSAIEVDKRFGMRERISSALQLTEDEQESAIGQALIQDSSVKAERVDVRDKFPIRPAPQTPWVVLPALSCLALFWVPDVEFPLLSQLSPTNGTKPVIANVTKALREVVQKQRKDAEDKGLEEMAEILRNVEKKLGNLEKSEPTDLKKVLSDLNEIKKEMEHRKEALGDAGSLKKSLEGLKQIDKGPAEKLADALKDGDFEKAQDELEKMIEAMKKGTMTPEQEKQLEKQLGQIENAIEKAQSKIEQAKADAKSELAKAEQAGDVEKAAKLRQKLEQLQAAEQQMKGAQSVKDQLAKAKQALEQGDKEGAKEALQEMQDELQELAEQQQNADELSDMIDELQKSKNAANCPKCDGTGCEQCNGTGKKGQKTDKPGNGKKGEGQGFGDRDEEETDVKHFDAQVRDEMKKGETTFGGKVAGKNRKGTTKEEVHDAILRSTAEDPDAIENMSLPKTQRQQQREYFDLLRDKK